MIEQPQKCPICNNDLIDLTATQVFCKPKIASLRDSLEYSHYKYYKYSGSLVLIEYFAKGKIAVRNLVYKDDTVTALVDVFEGKVFKSFKLSESFKIKNYIPPNISLKRLKNILLFL